MRWRLAVFKAPSRCTSNTTSRGKLRRQERRTLSPHSSEISHSLRHACVKATERSQVSAKNQRRLQKRNQLGRREFLCTAPLASLSAPLAFRRWNTFYTLTTKPTEMRIDDVSYDYEEFRYRTPYKFAGKEVDRATILNVRCVAHLTNGRSAHGFGSMPMGNVWSFPSQRMSYDKTLGAMKALAERVRNITASFKETGHPIDINVALEPDYLKAADRSEEHTSELQSRLHLVCRLLLEKKKTL